MSHKGISNIHAGRFSHVAKGKRIIILHFILSKIWDVCPDLVGAFIGSKQE